MAKFRDRKANTSNTYIGNDVYADVLARSNARSAFDGPVMCNPEIMVRDGHIGHSCTFQDIYFADQNHSTISPTHIVVIILHDIGNRKQFWTISLSSWASMQTGSHTL
jgi:hypothetical protein